jgi:tetratricopeptide (TPR) repeat protein
MSLTPRWALFLLVLGGPLAAQTSEPEKPVPHVPKTPISREELDRREAHRLYARGVMNERRNRLVEAVRAYEAAARLDPGSAAIPRALAPLYLALDRTDDALIACRRTIARDREDYRTGFLLARQLRAMDRNDEAVEVLQKITRAKSLKERPDQAAQIWYDLATLQEQSGDLAGAEKSLRKVAHLFDNASAMVESSHFTREEVASQAAETYERLGRVCLKLKAVSRAVRAFEMAQKNDPRRAARLAFNLAQVQRDQGKYRDALTQLEVYLRSQPQGIEGYQLKLDLQRKLGRMADILPDLLAAAERDPHNLALQLLLAKEYRKGGRSADAEKLYNDLLDRYLNAEVYRGLFALHKEEGRSGAEKVLNRLDRALDGAAGDDRKAANANDAANARAMLSVLKDDADLVKMILEASIRRIGGRGRLSYATKGILASLAARSNQLDFAERLYRACLDHPAGLGRMEAEIYAGLLEVLQLEHKAAAIVEVARLGLAKAQQTNRVLFHRALVYAYLQLEKPKEALASADDAVTDSGKAQLLGSKKLRIYALSEVGQHQKALDECQSMLKEYNQGGELREVRLTLSRVLLQMGKHEESDEQLQKILEADPNDATACNDLAYHWADRNKHLEEAERLIRKAMELDRKQRTGSGTAFAGNDGDQDNAAFVDTLGWVLFRLGKLEEARAELEKASKLPSGDDDPVVFDHLADVYMRLKEKDRALLAWKKALALFDQGTRRKSDDRYKEIQDKIRLLKP